MNVQDFIGEKATYDPDGQYIWGVDYDGGHQKLADLRGWGAIQNAFMSKGGMVDQEKAASFQDELGRWLADAINERLAKERMQGVISRFEREKWESAYLQKPSAEMIEKQERAFNAALAYEKNCLKHEAKCIDPRMAKIPKGEHMSDFAMRYGTTVKEMKDQWRQVESALANGL